MISVLVFACGAIFGAALVYFAGVRPLRLEERELSARMAMLNRRLGPWVQKDLARDDTFSESEIPTKK